MSVQRLAAPREPSVSALVDRLVQFQGPPEAFLQELLATQCQLASAEAGAMLRPGAGGKPPQLVAAYPPITGDQPAPLWLAQALDLMQRSGPLSRPVTRPLQRPDDLYGTPAEEHLILLPVRGGRGARGAAAFLVRTADPVALEQRQHRLELSLSLLSLYEMRLTLQQRQAHLTALATAVEVLAATNDHTRFRAAAMAACNEIANRWKAERVSFGLLKGRYVKLYAMNGTAHVSRKMQLVQDLESAMEECLDQDVEILHPAPNEATYVARATAELAQRHGPSAVLSLPLRRGGEVVGVLTLERPIDQPWPGQDVEFLRLTADLITPRLLELHEHDRWFGARAATKARKLLAAAVGPQHTWAKVTALALLAVVLFLVFARGPYRVEAPFVIETVERQIIAAPFDGYLEQVHVEPGDAVTAGETVLASLDTADLRLELARARAERARYLKEADLARRDGKTVEVQIAQARADEAAASIRLLEHRLAQAQLTSPISGVVIEGELKRHVGAAVTQGDVLFEVAPLEALRAVLHVPDDRIAEVHEGQRGELASASYPGVYVPFEIEHVSRVAEVIEQRNVFRVRARLLDVPEHVELRPGMEGLAKADAGRRSYAWIWTRDAINWLRMQLWM